MHTNEGQLAGAHGSVVGLGCCVRGPSVLYIYIYLYRAARPTSTSADVSVPRGSPGFP